MRNYRSLVYPYIIWMLIMIVVPMLMILVYAFSKQGNSVRTLVFTLENFASFFEDQIFIDVMKKSVGVALVTTILCVLLGYPVAYVIARSPRGESALIMLITIPMWINMMVRTYAWVGMLQDNGLFNDILGFFGIPAQKLLYTDFSVILGMVYNFIPFMILQIYTSLSKMDKSYLEAAKDLGADEWTAFVKVTLPLSVPGIISGITLVFLPAVSSFFIPKLLGGGQYVLIGNVIENQFLTAGNWSFGSAISLIMTVIILISMYITKRFDRNIGTEGSE